MAVVPVVQRTVMPTMIAAQQQQAAPVSNDAVGRAVQGLGQNLMNASESFERMAAEENEAAVKAADAEFNNALRDIQFNPEKGFYNQKGKAAVDAYGVMPKELTKLQQQFAMRLKSPAQQQLFNDVAQRRISGTLDSMARYTQSERKAYQDGTSLARVESALQDTGAFWNDDNRVRQNIALSRNEILDQAERNGWSPELTNVKLQDVQGKIYGAQIQGMLATEKPDTILSARQLYEKNRSQLDYETMQQLDKKFAVVLPAAIAQKSFAEFNAGAGGGDFSSIMQNVIFPNEGGFVAVDGASGAPANMGINQRANPDVDVKSLTKNQAAVLYKERYWDKYGIEQLAPDVRDVVFDGVINHGGEGAFGKSLVKAARDGATRNELITMRQKEYDRLAQSEEYAPYKKGWDARLQKLYQGAQTKAVDYTAAQQRAAALEKEAPGAGTEFLKLAALQEKQQKQQSDAMLGDAYKQILNNGGNYNALTPQQLDMLPPQEIDNLIKFADKIAAGQKINTDWGLYYELKTNPDMLRDSNLEVYFGRLNPTERKQLIEEQQSLRTGNTAATSNLRSGGQVLQNWFNQVGLDPKKDAAVIGNIWSLYEQEVRAQETATGKKLTSEELNKVAARLFVEVQASREGFGNDPRRAFELQPGDVVRGVTVPDAERAKIEAALSEKGLPVTDEMIQSLYAEANGIEINDREASRPTRFMWFAPSLLSGVAPKEQPPKKAPAPSTGGLTVPMAE